jgi:hypothetical protein
MKKKIISIILIILVLIGVGIYYYYKLPYVHNLLLINPKYLHTNISGTIPNNKLPDSKEGIKFTYSFWLYIKNIPENGNWNAKYIYPKYIIYRYGSPNVVYFTKNNKIRIYMSHKDNYADVVKDYIEIEDITLQEWNNITFTVDNREFDVYVNGELYGSLNLKNVPLIFKRDLHLGEKHNNFNGHIAYLEYFNEKLNIDKIKDIYADRKSLLPAEMLSYSNEFYITHIK